MPAPTYTTTNFLNAVRVLGALPDNDITDEQLLIMANDAMETVIYPAIMELQSEYFVDTVSYDLDSNSYSIPGTSIATKLRYVKILQPNGQLIYNLPQLDPARTSEYSPGQNSPYIAAFFIRGNRVHLFPEQQNFSGGSIEIAYFVRPNQLVVEDDCGQVTAINEATRIVTLSQLPAELQDVGTDVCALDSQPSYDLRFESREITLVSSPNIQLDSVEDLEVGDFVCQEGTTCVLQIPVECRGLLVQATLCKALESIADPRWPVSQKVLETKLEQWRHMAKDRVVGNPITFRGANGIDGDEYRGYGPNGWSF